MLKAFKYRLYPTKEQQVLLNKHIGCSRFVYNLALETKQTAYAGNKVSLSRYDLMNMLPELKKELTWLNDVGAQSLQRTILNLDIAFTNFFRGTSEFPKFKSKNRGGSFHVPQHMKLDQLNNVLSIPKFREGIRCKVHRKFEGLVRQVTVSRKPTGKYFVSVLFEDAKSTKQKKTITEENTIGIDLGLKTFLVTSGGEEFTNPGFLKKSLGKLKYTQRKHSKHKGERTRQRLALVHEKVANQRKDFLHKVSTKLIRENQSIAVENLDINGMLKNKKVARSIQDASWGLFISMLEYKADWHGVNLLKIGRFDPSSKTCSECGYIKKDMTLADREWACPICLEQHDRDINAAINIKNFALRNYLCEGLTLKNHEELPTLVGALTHEDTTL